MLWVQVLQKLWVLRASHGAFEVSLSSKPSPNCFSFIRQTFNELHERCLRPEQPHRLPNDRRCWGRLGEPCFLNVKMFLYIWVGTGCGHLRKQQATSVHWDGAAQMGESKRGEPGAGSRAGGCPRGAVSVGEQKTTREQPRGSQRCLPAVRPGTDTAWHSSPQHRARSPRASSSPPAPRPPRGSPAPLAPSSSASAPAAASPSRL